MVIPIISINYVNDRSWTSFKEIMLMNVYISTGSHASSEWPVTWAWSMTMTVSSWLPVVLYPEWPVTQPQLRWWWATGWAERSRCSEGCSPPGDVCQARHMLVMDRWSPGSYGQCHRHGQHIYHRRHPRKRTQVNLGSYRQCWRDDLDRYEGTLGSMGMAGAWQAQ